MLCYAQAVPSLLLSLVPITNFLLPEFAGIVAGTMTKEVNTGL